MSIEEEFQRLIKNKIITREQFSNKIEKMYVMQNGNISFRDLIIFSAEYFEIDLKDIAKFITEPLRNKIAAEAISENLLRVSDKEKLESLNSFFVAV